MNQAGFSALIESRPDYGMIIDWIGSGSRVLDLGCGDGDLMGYLAAMKGVSGYGIELDDKHISTALAAGINVIQLDLNEGLAEFDDNSFDYVVLSLTLQAIKRPDLLVREMLRVGTEGIVTFPNFGHWASRWCIAARGRMPRTPALPNQWYDTPNIHLCTVRDFDALCEAQGIRVLERCTVDHSRRSSVMSRIMPNLFGEVALYRFGQRISGNG